MLITGDGRIDAQSELVQAPIGVINYAKNHKCSIFVFAGSIQDSVAFLKKYGVNEAHSIFSRELSLEDALEHPTENLIAISRLAAKDFKKNYADT